MNKTSFWNFISKEWKDLLKSVEKAFEGLIIPPPWIPYVFYTEIVDKYLNDKSNEISRNINIVSWLDSAAEIPFDRIPVLYSTVNTFAQGVLNFRLQRGT